jgi:hypothetical protein
MRCRKKLLVVSIRLQLGVQASQPLTTACAKAGFRILHFVSFDFFFIEDTSSDMPWDGLAAINSIVLMVFICCRKNVPTLSRREGIPLSMRMIVVIMSHGLMRIAATHTPRAYSFELLDLTASLPLPILSKIFSRSLSVFNFVTMTFEGWTPMGTD